MVRDTTAADKTSTTPVYGSQIFTTYYMHDATTIEQLVTKLQEGGDKIHDENREAV